MSNAMLCDNCRTARTDSADVAGWLVLSRIPTPQVLQAQHPMSGLLRAAMGAAVGEATSTPCPIERGVHFCSDDCLIAYVRSGMRGLMEVAQS